MDNQTNNQSDQESKICGAPAIRVTMLPRDTNKHGTVFGGVILSHLDLAGDVEARKHASKNFVTVALRGVEFIAPVFVGDLVSFYTRTKRLGRTSVTVEVIVEAERDDEPHDRVRVMEAEVVYVAVDDKRRPIPIRE
jgi:acyl-CoA thioesterase YciA